MRKEFRKKLTSLEATLVQNYDPATVRLTGVKTRATRVELFVILTGTYLKREILTQKSEKRPPDTAFLVPRPQKFCRIAK